MQSSSTEDVVFTLQADGTEAEPARWLEQEEAGIVHGLRGAEGHACPKNPGGKRAGRMLVNVSNFICWDLLVLPYSGFLVMMLILGVLGAVSVKLRSSCFITKYASLGANYLSSKRFREMASWYNRCNGHYEL